MDTIKFKQQIINAETSLGIEFGSTRVKAVLVNAYGDVLATGGYNWENELKDGLWTYSKEAVNDALRASYKALADEVKKVYGVALNKIGAIGISAMMHGYLAFDKEGKLLVPFRTWRNTNTTKAAEELTSKLCFNIPERWSVAHLFQAALDNEPHVKDIAYLTTLAGYVHWQLTGERVLGIGDASGMMPIKNGVYDHEMIDKINVMLKNKKFDLDFATLLPKVLSAGEEAGRLSECGAKLLDVEGNLKAGIPFCPPEGDAGTGMTATNSVRAHRLD